MMFLLFPLFDIYIIHTANKFERRLKPGRAYVYMYMPTPRLQPFSFKSYTYIYMHTYMYSINGRSLRSHSSLSCHRTRHAACPGLFNTLRFKTPNMMGVVALSHQNSAQEAVALVKAEAAEPESIFGRSRMAQRPSKATTTHLVREETYET